MQVDLNTISKTLEKMAELELAISEFYKTAGELFKEDLAFWSGLAEAEVLHAHYMGRMADIVKRKPQEFEAGRPLNINTTDLVISNVKNFIQRLKRGDLNRKQTLIISRDTEQGILESKYAEIVITKDIEYQTLISEIAVQTETHRNLIFKKIEQTK
jgi:hypothetical protein